jgi:hypothetical protein
MKLKLPFKVELEKDAEILDFIELNKGTFLLIQKRKFKDKEFVDIRKYVTTTKYTGFTQKGITLEPKAAKTLGEKLLKVKL